MQNHNSRLAGRLRWGTVLLVLLAAALRLHRLEVVPLRGDEAFSLLNWAQPPAAVWQGLAAWEPHPIGTFMLFWLWKSLLGTSEFAMRSLPLLVNLLGVPVMVAWGRYFFRQSGGSVAWLLPLLLGLLWALNPFQVWHAQDLRNYALWAALSPLALLLFVRALEGNRPRSWAAYILAQSAACYLFLLEPFFLLVQLLYLLCFYRHERRLLQRSLFAWMLLALLLLPLGLQVLRLADSGYAGTAQPVSLALLLRDFLPTLLFGEARLSWWAGGMLFAVLLLGLLLGPGERRQRFLLLAWLFLPLLLLTLFGTAMSIFLPRYVIPLTAPLLLALLWIVQGRRRDLRLVGLVAGVLLGVSVLSLYAYFYTDPPKAPDWRGLGQFLEARATADDVVIIANVDPAFGYYYHGAAAQIPQQQVSDPVALRDQYASVYVQNAASTSSINEKLQATAQLIPPSTPLLRQYRSYEPGAEEIQQPLHWQLGEVARLHGYALQGGDAFGLTVLLYWEPLQRTATEMVGFVHLVDGAGRVVAQDDHAPLNGDANTTVWLVGDLLRDPYHMRPPPGDYSLVVGMYPAGGGEPLPVYDASGQPQGDRITLATLSLPQ